MAISSLKTGVISPGSLLAGNAGYQTTSPSTVEYLIAAAGGGGGAGDAGGGGAGGYRTSNSFAVTAGVALTVTIGAGGAAASYSPGPWVSSTNGTDSVFSSITSTGGGRGGSLIDGANLNSGNNGGSGGGQGRPGYGSAGTGNTPSTSPSQGNNGGNGTGAALYKGGGGGGSSSAGSGATAGAGTSNSISGSAVTYAAGGAGDAIYNSGTPATVNTGNGGPGAGTGGSGIVIIAYPDSYKAATLTNLTYTQPSRTGYRVYSITASSSGTITFQEIKWHITQKQKTAQLPQLL